MWNYNNYSAAKSVGVIPDPEINVLELTPEDKIIVIASDGIWEFLSNRDVITNFLILLFIILY